MTADEQATQRELQAALAHHKSEMQRISNGGNAPSQVRVGNHDNAGRREARAAAPTTSRVAKDE